MTKDVEKVSKALETVFSESSDFIIIGLTGRTGSGCSTSASILSMNKLPLPDIGNSHYTGNEARKYRIVKKYIDNKWQPFDWLQVRSVITRYLLELNFSEFVQLASQILSENPKDIRKYLIDFKPDYDKAHRKIKQFISLEENSIDEINVKKESAYNIYFKLLPPNF